MKSNAILLAALMTAAACTATEATDEEDAAAAIDGKADGVALKGIFHSEAPGLQVIALHGPSRSAPTGSTGYFDLSRSTDEDGYETEALQGTYKLYQYRGRNRIKLVDAEGNELLREDWTYADNELSIGESQLRRNVALAEDLVGCLALNVSDQTILAESFSVFEYPHVSAEGPANGDATSLTVGGSSFDTSDATLTTTRTAAELTVQAVTSSDETYTLRVANSAPRRGTLTYQADGEAAVVLANVICHQ